MKQSEKEYRRIVIKIGSSLFWADKKRLDFAFVEDIARQVFDLVKTKKEVLIVSSGAIACGVSILGMESRPRELSYLQAAAAVGQHELMNVYYRYFNQRGLNCAQVLLTWEDFDDRRRYLNARLTLLTLLKLGSIPVINENDTVSTDEIKFGDNDKLSALVAGIVNADILIILSDVDGLLERDKKTVVKIVERITPEVEALACPTGSKTCVGGMVTKLEAAKIATDSGIPCVIANGRHKDIILSAVSGPLQAGLPAGQAGTLFVPKKIHLAPRMRWIAFGTKPKGQITVDEGAKNALLNKKSLLSVGVVEVKGNFEAGDIVSVIDKETCEFARGKVSLPAKQLDKAKGSRLDKEVIHRDNIVIL